MFNEKGGTHFWPTHHTQLFEDRAFNLGCLFFWKKGEPIFKKWDIAFSQSVDRALNCSRDRMFNEKVGTHFWPTLFENRVFSLGCLFFLKKGEPIFGQHTLGKLDIVFNQSVCRTLNCSFRHSDQNVPCCWLSIFCV